MHLQATERMNQFTSRGFARKKAGKQLFLRNFFTILNDPCIARQLSLSVAEKQWEELNVSLPNRAERI